MSTKRTDTMTGIPAWGTAAIDPPLVEKHGGPYCFHHNTEISRTRRQLTCRACGAVLDPIDYLLTLSRDGNRIQWAREEADRLSKEVQALTAERNRLKSSVAGLKKRRGG